MASSFRTLSNPYELIAETYDLENAHYNQDLPFWQSLAERTGSPILELACGTGRVAISLCRAGYEVWGLDSSPRMLERCRAKLDGLPEDVQARITLIEGDMRSFQLGQKFALILLPYNSFNFILDLEDQRNCLRCVREHLADDGLFALDTYLPSIKILAEDVEDRRLERRRYDVSTGTWHATYYTRHYDQAKQQMDVLSTYEETKDSHLLRSLDRPLIRHMFYPRELRLLLEGARLQICERYGGFDCQPLSNTSKKQIVVCRAV